MKKLLIFLLITTSCEKEYIIPEESNNTDYFLEIHSDLEHNGDLYIFNYPNNTPSSYFKVNYNSLPIQRVYWNSPDMFYVIVFNDTIWTEVVNFSTYANDNGIGHQMVYVNPTLIGDTLNIIGEIKEYDKSIRKEILIKIE